MNAFVRYLGLCSCPCSALKNILIYIIVGAPFGALSMPAFAAWPTEAQLAEQCHTEDFLRRSQQFVPPPTEPEPADRSPERSSSENQISFEFGEDTPTVTLGTPLAKGIEKFCRYDEATRTGRAQRSTEEQRKLESNRDEAYIELLQQPDPTGRIERALPPVVSALIDRAIQGTAALVADRAQAELALWLVARTTRLRVAHDAIELRGFDGELLLEWE